MPRIRRSPALPTQPLYIMHSESTLCLSIVHFRWVRCHTATCICRLHDTRTSFPSIMVLLTHAYRAIQLVRIQFLLRSQFCILPVNKYTTGLKGFALGFDSPELNVLEICSPVLAIDRPTRP